jgi:hypothetical protein
MGHREGDSHQASLVDACVPLYIHSSSLVRQVGIGRVTRRKGMKMGMVFYCLEYLRYLPVYL